MQTTAIILAAGIGTRMKSRLPKALQPIAGQPMLRHLLTQTEAAFDRSVVVIGPGMDALAALAAPHDTVIQHQRRGTAHAALAAAAHFGAGQVAILYADNPLIRAATLRSLTARLAAGDAGLVLIATTPPAPPYLPGRVVTDSGYVTRIVDAADASPEELNITLCNAGGLMAAAADMARWLAAVTDHNAQGEFYLTDIIRIAADEGVRIAAIQAPFTECLGVNSRAELAAAEAVVQAGLRAAALNAGVAMAAPETVFLSADTTLAEDVIIGPYVVFGPGVTVEAGVEIKAFSHLQDCTVREGAIIGPYARLRPGADIGAGAHVGNFCEIKAATLGAGAKVNHLSYIGDAAIGAGTNIGAGTITCNYDGKTKHHTSIGANAFIGSNTALVAPVTVGDNAFVAAGSTITETVAAGSLAIARGRQVTKPNRRIKLKPQ
jgi:bifunctional UDP-N-acetylglucosamine pyrophosphorylase/glucosamine-1-phosphate N-acetyltransferase